tara:strand:- start:442 stop:1971 length:1530 start_codon:yes stop_codon:yes gene_type:complete
MNIIKQFEIDTLAMSSNSLTSKKYFVVGDEGCFFTLIVTDDEGLYYNFPENTETSLQQGIFAPAPAFSSTFSSLSNKEIIDTGVYEGEIYFPSHADDNKYKITLLTGANTQLDTEVFLHKNSYVLDSIEKLADTVITFAGGQSGSLSGPTSVTVSGKSSQIEKQEISNKISLDFDYSVSSDTILILRQPVFKDFEFTINSTAFSASSSSSTTELELADVRGISSGMIVVSGSDGIGDGTVVLKVIKGFRSKSKSTLENPVYVIPLVVSTDDNFSVEEGFHGTVVLSQAQSWSADEAVKFRAGGSNAKAYNNTRFKISNIKASLSDITIKTTAATSNTVIASANVNGLKQKIALTVNGATTASKTVIVDEAVTSLGVGQILTIISSGSLIGYPVITAIDTSLKKITLSTAQTFSDGITINFAYNSITGVGVGLHNGGANQVSDLTITSTISTISSNNITTSGTQAIESQQSITYTGTSRAAKITADIEILEYGDNDITLTLAIDNILKII